MAASERWLRRATNPLIAWFEVKATDTSDRQRKWLNVILLALKSHPKAKEWETECMEWSREADAANAAETRFDA